MPTVSFPARCAVAVICGENLVSQVYPASVPIEVFIDNIVELLNDDLKRRGAAPLDAGIAYELQRANGTRLDATKALDDLGVEDGSTLVLVPAERGESFEPQYESLSTGLAEVGKSLFAPVTAETAVTTSLAILGMIVVTVLGLTVHTRMHTESAITAVATLVLGAALGFGAFSVWRWWPARWQLSSGLGWLAVPLLAVGFAAAAPGSLGGAHLFIGALALAVLTCGLVTVTDRNVIAAATVVTLCAIGGVIAAVRMWQPVAAQRLGMCALIGLLLLLSAGPTIALWVARIRPPHFGSITGRDVFRRSDGMPVDAVTPVDDEVGEEPNRDETPRGSVIAGAARRANGVLTGICVAAAIALPMAVWFTLMPGQPKSAAAALLALLFVLIFISRGRAFADRRQAVALVCGAAAGLCSGVVRYVLHLPAPSVAPLIWGSLVLAGFAAAGLAAALLVPVTRFTPLVRMVAEWLELAAIVVALPMAAWVGGLFNWVRMR
ncbi:MAG: type VII secretion integral membrane protein EccD [Mycobacteriaceae bacterium]